MVQQKCQYQPNYGPVSKGKPPESGMHCVEELFESEYAHTSTKQVPTILDYN